jgi:hypothetical protein
MEVFTIRGRSVVLADLGAVRLTDRAVGVRGP